ncbi:MAG: class C beta-lactamase-related serine hydrolase [Mesorhizobium sp.]|nr:MAG: class C beta-lactamase-related serine hydrolase [Mesorhizobium sp.]
MRLGGPMIPRMEWDFAPYNRWTFQHVREFVPSASIWRGRGPALPLPERPADIEDIEFEVKGRRSTIREFLDSSFTDGFLVLHRGMVISETYMNGLQPHGQHLAMSMSKSIAAIVCGILVHQGLIDTQSPVTLYLPELEFSAYRGATVQHVLDMCTGVTVTGPYTEPGTHAYMMQRAAGWKPLESTNDPQSMWQLILRLTEQQRPHGAMFDYRSTETNVLGFVMQRASGKPLAELISSELWSPMGAEEDAYITVDPAGFPIVSGGFNATLRDYGRFALLLVRNGALNGRQIVSSKWIEQTRSGNSDLVLGGIQSFSSSTSSAPTTLPAGGYHNQFWIEDPRGCAYTCRGAFGQFMYIDPQADFAAVKLSAWPEAVDEVRTAETLAAIHAIKAACE